MTEIIAICAVTYLVGAYAFAFVNGYTDSPVSSALFWPLYIGAWLVIGAVIPFVWIGAWLYNVGSALRGNNG